MEGLGPVVRWALAAACGALLVAAAWVVVTRIGGLLPELEQPELTVDMALSRMKLTHGQDGRVTWQLDADSARTTQERNTMDLASPLVKYFASDGETLTVQAAKGEVDQATGAMRLVSDVVGAFKDADLSAHVMTFDGEDVVEATGEVRMVRQGAVLLAPKVRYSLTKGVLTALNGVQVTIPGNVSKQRERR